MNNAFILGLVIGGLGGAVLGGLLAIFALGAAQVAAKADQDAEEYRRKTVEQMARESQR